MSKIPEPLDRAEKATSLLRNVVIVLGALSTLAIFLIDRFAGNVRAEFDSMQVDGSRYLITDRDSFSTLPGAGTASTKTTIDSISAYHQNIGRLDRISRLIIQNDSKKPVQLLIKIKFPKRNLPDPTDIEKGAFMRSAFLLADVFSDCLIEEDPLTIGDNGYIRPGAIGTLALKDFPVGCSLQLQFAHCRSDPIVVSAYADGALLDFEDVRHIPGNVGKLAATVRADPPWSYIFVLVVPIVALILLVLFAAAALWRKPKNEKNDQETKSSPQMTSDS